MGQGQMFSPLAGPLIVMVEKKKKRKLYFSVPACICKDSKEILQKSHNIKTLNCHKSLGMVLTYIEKIEKKKEEEEAAEYRARVKVEYLQMSVGAL